MFLRALKNGFLGFLGLRFWTTLLMTTASLSMPGRLRSDYPYVETVARWLESNFLNLIFIAPWYRFDSVHYIEIAEGGYTNPVLSTWAPLYPLLIKTISLTGIPLMTSSLIVSNLACILALAFFYLLIRKSQNERTAQRSLILLLVFPSSFFLLAGYTESLFILLACASLLCMLNQNWIPSGILASLATLARFQGVVLCLPLIWLFWEWIKAHPGLTLREILFQKKFLLLALCLPPLTFFGWTAWIHFGLNFPWPWETLNQYWQQHTGLPWEGIIGNFTSLTHLRQITTPITTIAQFFDLFLILVVIVISSISIRNSSIPKFFQVFTWGCLFTILVKVDNQWLLVSASRYLLSAFTFFPALSFALKNNFSYKTWIVLSLLGQLLLLLCFYNWIWVA